MGKLGVDAIARCVKFELRRGEICNCGRRADVIHCAHCGSSVLYGLTVTTKRLNEETLEEEEYVTYRCRRCKRLFDDWSWRFDCRAPVQDFKRNRTRLNPTFAQKFTQENTLEEQTKIEIDAAVEKARKLGLVINDERKKQMYDGLLALKQQEKEHKAHS